MGKKEDLKVLKKRVLSDCRPDFGFWNCNDRVVRNMYELADSIENMNDCVFCYHVNDDHQKNDFAKWVDEVLGDDELAGKLKGIRNRIEYAGAIRARINELEKA